MMPLLLALLLLPAAPQPKTPLSVVLVVDVSNSVTRPFVRRDRTLVRDAGSALAGAIEADDTVRLGVFGDTIVVDPLPLRDGAAIRARAEMMNVNGGSVSPVWDALARAASALEADEGRRGIVLVTDGRSTGNRLGFADIVAQLRRAGIPVFVVSVDADEGTRPDPGARLKQLAKETGGTCLFVDRKVMPAAIARSVRTLRVTTATTR
jgi:hypothetical protein